MSGKSPKVCCVLKEATIVVHNTFYAIVHDTGGIPRNVALRDYTSLRVGGEVALWEVNSLEQLRTACAAPYRVIGAGSNLLVADSGVPERVIKLGAAFNSLAASQWHYRAQRREALELWIGAATPLPGLIRRAQRAGLSGLEGLLGIPAVLGGAVAMNAGTRFGEIGDSLLEVELFMDGKLERLPASALALRYRQASLPAGAVLTRAKVRLQPSTPEEVAARMQRVDEARRGQPKGKSAGCAFKNPAGDSAGRLIDSFGLKGLRVGQAMVAHEHANFIVNLGGAQAADIYALLQEVRARVTPHLLLEWELWGFERSCACTALP